MALFPTAITSPSRNVLEILLKPDHGHKKDLPVLSKDARLPAGKYKKRTCGDDGSRATEEASVTRTPVSELLYISTYTVLGA